MAIREGAWDCPHCGTERNRGPERFCGGCGAPRGEDVKFYLPEDARVVQEQEELKRAKGGPDWNCSYCGGDNYGYNNYCTGCGGPRDGSADKEGKEYKVGAIPRSQEDLEKMQKASPKSDKEGKRSQEKKSKEKKPESIVKRVATIGCFIIFCLAIAFISFSFYRAFSTREVSLEVTGLYWERVIEIQKIKTLTEKAWEGELPADARYVSETREIHHYDKVQIGTETKTETVTEKVKSGTKKVKVGVKDLGNGYFEDVYETKPVYKDVTKTVTKEVPVYKDEPVYKNKITYEVDRWQVNRRERAYGTGDDAPYWPEITLEEGEREGNKIEKYMVALIGPKGNTYDYEAPSEAEWRKFQVGKSYKAKISGFGSLKSVEVE